MYFCYFFPVGLDVPRRRQPWLSIALAGSILGVFAWLQWFSDRLPLHPWDLAFYVGHSPAWTVLSALLLHAGWLHVLGNLIYLVALLPALEDRLGPAGAFLLFAVTGAGGNLAHGLAAWQGWAGQGGLGILGASGAISGLLGFALVRLAHARIAVAYWIFSPLQGQNRAGRALLPLPAAVLVWLLLQVVQAALAAESGSLVSYPAHLGGFGLGLVLAVAMGGVRDGRAESTLQRARAYLARGEGLAAAGAYVEYRELAPSDRTAAREHARALVMAGRTDEAAGLYRESFREAAAAGRWDQALDILEEGRRCGHALGLSRDELAAAAHRAEKAGDQELALWIYEVLVLKAGDHPASNRAWVRLLMLLHDDPGRRAEAGQWLEVARRTLPPGAWRDYLERTFSPRPAARAALGADPAGVRPGPGA
jgi:membrane associated rhomboid family serine protease